MQIPSISIELKANGADSASKEFTLSLTLDNPKKEALGMLVRAVQLAFAVATGEMDTEAALKEMLAPAKTYPRSTGPGGRD